MSNILSLCITASIYTVNPRTNIIWGLFPFVIYITLRTMCLIINLSLNSGVVAISKWPSLTPSPTYSSFRFPSFSSLIALPEPISFIGLCAFMNHFQRRLSFRWIKFIHFPCNCLSCFVLSHFLQKHFFFVFKLFSLLWQPPFSWRRLLGVTYHVSSLGKLVSVFTFSIFLSFSFSHPLSLFLLFTYTFKQQRL